jgi:hypothetical protein
LFLEVEDLVKEDPLEEDLAEEVGEVLVVLALMI